ncbi:MAG TPA: tRNA (adenosine(37)-N6)-threonylcarbamoyltransferase complex dimerization subunit type 1 TsaB [Acidimicrobiales bacterium]|nr:tRNA (adenosine(37)-N6)-threonylcarbamoyltransferase complex dimerization subunit type 1 TsaB [Acidimicrobiales bacterium]
MNVLAIETATSACAVGVATTTGRELTRVIAGERHHNEVLVPTIADLLRQAKLAPHAIERVVVDHGPGLFTGLRVGVATAIAFAQGVGASLVELSSLELLAYGARRDGVAGEFVAVVDARRGELFVQRFRLDRDVRALNAPVVTTPAELLATWREGAAAVTLGGDGLARYADLLAPLASQVAGELTVPPVLEALRLGATRDVVATVTPLYLREPDAVVNFSTRERS